MQKPLEIFRELFDEKATLISYKPQGKISLYLISSYNFYLAEVLGVCFFVIEPLGDKTTQQIKIHFQTIQAALQLPCVLYEKELTRYKFRKLIREKIPFITDCVQVYLPFMGIFLRREPAEKVFQPEAEVFTPSAQMVFLEILYGEHPEITQQELSRKLDCSVMTCSRALEQMVAFNLLEYRTEGKTGRQKIYYYQNKAAFFAEGKRYLINPIKKSIFVREIPPNIRVYLNGLSALSKKTMLADPDHLILAVSGNAEREVKLYQQPQEIGREEHLAEIQIMKYDIGLFAKEGMADPITVICSIRESDERIEMAVDEMMEEYEWYRE